MYRGFQENGMEWSLKQPVFFTQQGHEISHKTFTLNHEESEPTKANASPHAKKQQSAKHVVSPDETLPENFPAASAPGLQMLSVQT